MANKTLALELNRSPVNRTDISMMQIGDLAEVIEASGSFCPKHVILRTYEGYVDLGEPRRTWSKGCYDVPVRILLRGESVLLLVKE